MPTNIRFQGLVKTTAEIESDKFAGRIGWNSTLARFVAYYNATQYATMARRDVLETFALGIQDSTLGVGLPMFAGTAGRISTESVANFRSRIGAQPSDATLTALAGLATGANQLPYSTGTDTFAQTPFTAFARTLLDDADAATARATLGAQAAGSYQLSRSVNISNANYGAGYIKFATITIPGGTFASYNAKWAFDGKEIGLYLVRRLILTFSVRRDANGYFDARLYCTETGSTLSDTISVRTNDGITWDFYVDATADVWCAYYYVTPEFNYMPDVSNTFIASASMPTYSTVIEASRYGYAHRLVNARTLTIGNTGKSFDGTADVSWTLADIGAQPLDADLTAIAGLSTQPFGRSLLTQADAATARATLGAGTSNLALGETSSTAYRGDRGATAYTHSQATGNPHGTTFAQIASIPAAIDAIDGLTPAADRIAYYTGANGAALTPLSAFGRSLIDDADAATARATLGAAASTEIDTRTQYLVSSTPGASEWTLGSFSVAKSKLEILGYVNDGSNVELRLYSGTELFYSATVAGGGLFHLKLELLTAGASDSAFVSMNGAAPTLANMSGFGRVTDLSVRTFSATNYIVFRKVIN